MQVRRPLIKMGVGDKLGYFEEFFLLERIR